MQNKTSGTILFGASTEPVEYLEPSQTFLKKSSKKAKELHHRCLTWFYIGVHEHNFTFNIFQKSIVYRRFYLNRNKILSLPVKDKSFNSPEGLQLY